MNIYVDASGRGTFGIYIPLLDFKISYHKDFKWDTYIEEMELYGIDVALNLFSNYFLNDIVLYNDNRGAVSLSPVNVTWESRYNKNMKVADKLSKSIPEFNLTNKNYKQFCRFVKRKLTDCMKGGYKLDKTYDDLNVNCNLCTDGDLLPLSKYSCDLLLSLHESDYAKDIERYVKARNIIVQCKEIGITPPAEAFKIELPRYLYLKEKAFDKSLVIAESDYQYLKSRYRDIVIKELNNIEIELRSQTLTDLTSLRIQVFIEELRSNLSRDLKFLSYEEGTSCVAT